MNKTSSSQDERIRQAADQLFIEAKHVGELTREKVLELAGGNLKPSAFVRAFPGKQFNLLRRAWLSQRIEQAMTTAFAAAKVQQDVTIQQVADLAGCDRTTVRELAGPHYYARRLALPEAKQLLLQAIERLVETRVPLQEYTWARVYAEAGERPSQHRSDELIQAFADGLETLTRNHEQQRDPGATYAFIQGGWINVDEPAWYLPSLGRTIRRDELRPDIAALAWPLLREEALMESPSASTLYVHYSSCRRIAEILGDTVSDIRALTQLRLQQAWLRAGDRQRGK